MHKLIGTRSRQPTEEDYTQRLTETTSQEDVLHALWDIEEQFEQGRRGNIEPTIPLADALLATLIVKPEWEQSYKDSIHHKAIGCLHYINKSGEDNHDETNVLAAKDNMVELLWKAFDSANGNQNYEADILRLFQCFYDKSPKHANDPQSANRMLDIIVGNGPLFPRLIAVEALNQMIVCHHDLAKISKKVTTGKPQSSKLRTSADALTQPKETMRLIDIMLKLSLNNDPWGDGNPLSEEGCHSYDRNCPLTEHTNYCFLNICHWRPDELSPSTFELLAIQKKDNAEIVRQKINGFLYITDHTIDLTTLPSATREAAIKTVGSFDNLVSTAHSHWSTKTKQNRLVQLVMKNQPAFVKLCVASRAKTAPKASTSPKVLHCAR